ncbi:MAG: YceI family protein [Anaerolineales bacterium]|nr:YceI family protein [Anaerolineales bacterium]MCB8959118.1 YceI family protein [Ardenticatenales bacterium]
MNWKIDPAHTQIGFMVRHMMIAKVRGSFGSYDGSIDLGTGDLAAATIAGTVAVASINTGDEQRDAHLRSADFFDVDNYPTMSFRSTRIEAAGADQYKLYGELTIKDTTQEVVLDVTNEGQAQDPWGGQRWGFTAGTKINRKAFGLTWNVALETGGWLVGDEVTISIELELVGQPESEAALA